MAGSDIVLISIDDLFNVDRMRTAFGVEISTPNYDRLKSMGVTFDNANASVALCNPSRTSILTGQNPFETGVHLNATTWYSSVSASETLPAILKAAGYTTMSFGKTFHSLDLPPDVSSAMFDTFFSPNSADYDFDSPVRWGLLTGDPNSSGDAITIDAALAALSAYTGVNPLFLMVGLVDPHAPFLAPQEFLDLYPLSQIVLPPWDGDSPPPYALSFIDPVTVDLLRGSNELIKLVQGYLANISEMDFRLGQLLDGIEASGRTPTIALFSDHGYHLGDHDTLHKFTLWEQASNAPLIIYHPDTASGGQVHGGVVSMLDIAPTLLDIAGVTIPPKMEGHSLLASVLDSSVPTFGVAVTTMGGSFSIRTGDWRYTRYQDGAEELFQISTDAENKHNLAMDPGYAMDLAAMSAQLDAYLTDIGVTFDAAGRMTVFEDVNGDSQYFVTSVDDLSAVTDLGGIDTIYTSAAVFVLPEWAERYFSLSRLDVTVTGRLGDDVIGAGGYDDLVYGLAGNDEISSSSGNDTVYGGDGADRILASANNDLVEGEGGADFINSGGGIDTVFGGANDDRIDGSLESDLLYGGMDSDRLLGGTGFDTLNGDDGNDTLIGQANHDSLFGGAGHDLAQGGGGDDTIQGGTGNDRLFGGEGSDAIDGGEGQDLLQGDAGNDSLSGLTDADTIYGGDGADNLFGGDADDVLFGDLGEDKIDGGLGADRLFGGEGADDLNAGEGNDQVSGGAGNDTIFGDLGRDFLRGNEGVDSLFGGLGNERIWGGTEDDWASGGDGADRIFGEDGNDQLIGGGHRDQLFGGDGDDSLMGGLANDVIEGGNGNDTLSGDRGADSFVWRAGEIGTDVVTDFEVGTDSLSFLGALAEDIAISQDNADTLIVFDTQTVRLVNVTVAEPLSIVFQ